MSTAGAVTAFKPQPAKAVGVKPTQVGGTKFPGKIDPNLSAKVGFKLAAPTLPITNPMLGAAFGLLFGRAANISPQIRDALSNPAIRDATIGAAVATALEEIMDRKDPDAPPVFNPRPAPPQNGWNLQ